MSKYQKLVNNSLIFAVGNLGSKLVIFFLVPLYTYTLTKSQYGLVDIFTYASSFIMPIFTLSVYDAVLRFVMDKYHNRKAVLINSIIIVLIGFVILILFFPLIKILLPFEEYILEFYLVYLFQSFYMIFSQYIRARGYLKLFAFSGILNSIVMLFGSIAFLLWLDWGIFGYLLSIIVSNIIVVFFIVVKGEIIKDIDLRRINKSLMTEMLKYSLPLIPNSVMWWIMGFSDRFIVTYFLGLGANGLYAIANKLPSVINILNSLFFQAWQMSAIEEEHSKEKATFYSKVFNIFALLMLLSTSILIWNLKLIMSLLVSPDFYSSWKYIPFLLLGTVFASFSGFLGTNYIVSKETMGVLKTSLVGAILNIIVSIILVPIIGINGAALGTMVSFGFVWILRIRDTKRFVNIKMNMKNLFLTLLTITVQIIILYANLEYNYFIQLFLVATIILINIEELLNILKSCHQLLNKKRRE
ncbi:lipopolysaccharide biosynthesis protein [Rossellomorea marisflavi]|uniref:Polysaccharide biosynthesis protein n=1 Tax=Rossellomorea marisflavi TaxID=189381 RepID=A0A165INV8_9BACI|nr:oligosaccharide flippase family protein [Rossellomorea marisflavi]KZE43898.1 polysaccharide biosynthesis protein [Rossellomorea marisflavi]